MPIRLDPIDLRDDGLVIDGEIGSDVDRIVRVNKDADEIVCVQRGLVSLLASHCGRAQACTSSLDLSYSEFESRSSGGRAAARAAVDGPVLAHGNLSKIPTVSRPLRVRRVSIAWLLA